MNVDIRTCQPVDLERLIPLLDEEFIFGKGRTLSLRQRFPSVYCHNNLHNIIICTDGEVITSSLAMRHFDWRDGEEVFRGAMIGAVYTHPMRRGEGFASRLLASATIRLREMGVDFGALWTGQQSFYARLGWVAVDCGVFGKIELNQSMSEPADEVVISTSEQSATRAEGIRQLWLNNMTLRHPEDYRQLPLPAENVEVLWQKNGMAAYALLGINGEAGYLYELAGESACFPALWDGVCQDRQRVYINDRADSPSYRWLSEHTKVNWEYQNQAMWLPLSKRVSMSRLEQWHIPYFDRI